MICEGNLGSLVPPTGSNVFLVDEGIQKPIIGPFRWHANECCLGSLVIFQGTWNTIDKKPIFLWFYLIFFFRGVRTPCTPYGSAHEFIFVNVSMILLYVCLSRFSNGRIQMGWWWWAGGGGMESASLPPSSLENHMLLWISLNILVRTPFRSHWTHWVQLRLDGSS